MCACTYLYVCMFVCVCVYSSVLFIREIGLTLFISGVAQSQCNNKQKHVGTSATCIDTDHVHVPSIAPHSVLVCRHLFLPGIGTFSVYTTSVCLVWCDTPIATLLQGGRQRPPHLYQISEEFDPNQGSLLPETLFSQTGSSVPGQWLLVYHWIPQRLNLTHAFMYSVYFSKY